MTFTSWHRQSFSQLQFPVLSWMVQTPSPILIALAKELTIFLASINLRRLVRWYIFLFPTIKTVNYTLNYTKKERVETKRKKREWRSERGSVDSQDISTWSLIANYIVTCIATLTKLCDCRHNSAGRMTPSRRIVGPESQIHFRIQMYSIQNSSR
jgi:hypothetical protein